MDLQSATILVVEDHRTTRTFLADNLSADGYEVIEAEGMAEARHLLSATFPDLAIVDLGLPDGDGLELLAHVRAADRIAGRLDPDLPLLVLSGRVSELDRLRGFDRGCRRLHPETVLVSRAERPRPRARCGAPRAGRVPAACASGRSSSTR